MKRLLLAAAVSCGMASSASAQGWYFAVEGGPNFLGEARNEGGGIDIESRYDPGFAFSGAVGYGFANGLRLEAELSYREDEVDRLEVTSDGGLGRFFGVPSLAGFSLPTSGEESALGALVNAWYDVRTGTRFTPYLGGGVGVARIALHDVEAGGLGLVNDDDFVFAYQLGAGVAIALVGNVAATVNYRFLGTTAPTFADFEGVEFDSEYHAHSITFGLRVPF